jgi:hypothetical protein
VQILLEELEMAVDFPEVAEEEVATPLGKEEQVAATFGLTLLLVLGEETEVQVFFRHLQLVHQFQLRPVPEVLQQQVAGALLELGALPEVLLLLVFNIFNQYLLWQ